MQTIHPQPATPAPTATGQAPYSLIGPFQDHLKFHGRPPRTLAEKLQARADYDHARRTAELKKLADKLALLEPLLPQLAALGAPVQDRTIVEWHAQPGPAVLRIQPGLFTNNSNDDKLHAALLSLGFREVEARAYGNATEDVTLKLGRALLVRITITQRQAAPAPAPAIAREGVAA